MWFSWKSWVVVIGCYITLVSKQREVSSIDLYTYLKEVIYEQINFENYVTFVYSHLGCLDQKQDGANENTLGLSGYSLFTPYRSKILLANNVKADDI